MRWRWDRAVHCLHTVFTVILFKLLYIFTLTLLKVRTLIWVSWASKQNVGVDGLEWTR